MRDLIVIPTYNERENIGPLIEQVFHWNPLVEILVVDDNSPDGTSQFIQELQKNNQKIHLLLRQQKSGLGQAYLAGFQWALDRGFETITEMDADFSHRPEDLKKILQEIRHHDFIVGSRYIPGGATVNWGIGRKLISRAGGLYSRLILGYPLNDWTGGFNSWKAETLRAIGLQEVKSNGYSFQIELKYRALKAGKKGLEVPIIFEDRRVGQSKMSSRIVFEALGRVVALKWKLF
jgi:dolichol-phosphate mannosyltransferase